jgi:2-dehydro-3-deoxygalactonokinase
MLLAVDWGTSSLRGALIDPQGRVLSERASARGILSVPAGGFGEVFDAEFGDWSALADLCLISGMAGSRQGWAEAAYCACPAGFGDLSRQLLWLPAAPGPARARRAIVPGLCCETDGVPDVMRGEEVQVFGALALLGLQDATLVLPGTHSKWVTARAGRVQHFRTAMTGEFYALLRSQSLLSRTLPPDDGDLDEPAFLDGVSRALRGPGLLQTAFSVRTLALFERTAPAAMPSYLSGLVIGEELRAQPLEAGGEVVAMGSAALLTRYRLALAQRRISVRAIGAEATWHGLRALADNLETP